MFASEERIVRDLLAEAGVRVGGSAPWDVAVHDDRFNGRVLRDKSLGLGESYMDGWWDCPRLDEFFHRVFSARLDLRIRDRLGLKLRLLPALLLDLRKRRRARRVADKQHDLGDDLFPSFLDEQAQYGCAYFDGVLDLDAAQRRKFGLICQKLELRPGERVLDLGCGWGGLAAFMADRGCRVTAVNASKEQLRRARDVCAGKDVRILERDYRDLEGDGEQPYDKIVCAGMFEHVGVRNYKAFMRAVEKRLASDGIFLLHAIAGNESMRGAAPWIGTYLFPNVMPPSLTQIAEAAETLFVIEDVHNLGPRYDKTLMAWNEKFQAAWPRLRESRDETFRRMWEYCLLSCAGAFRSRTQQVLQIVLTKPGRRQPRRAA